MRKPWSRRPKVAEDVDAEVAHHIELRARRFIDRGMPAEQAWAEARQRFGPAGTTDALIAAAHAREKRMHWSEWIDGLANDGEDDRAGSAPVVIVNETAARMWWPNGGAIGKCIRIGADSAPCAAVVGVAENVRRFGIEEGEAVQFYAPLEQLPSEGPPNVVYVRTTGAAPLFQDQLQRRLQGAAPGLPYVGVQLVAELVAPRMQSWRMGAIMFGIFGALAIVLASVGLYGVLAYDVAQRQQEIGVRLALGASRSTVARLVMGRGFTVVGIGAIGLAATLACGRLVEPLLFRTSPYDPLILGAVAVLMLAVSVIATLVPTARATRVDPSLSLRNG